MKRRKCYSILGILCVMSLLLCACVESKVNEDKNPITENSNILENEMKLQTEIEVHTIQTEKETEVHTIQTEKEIEILLPMETEALVMESEEIELSYDERYEVNIFLSNFSEQHWPIMDEVFVAEHASAETILRFVFWHVYINEESLYENHLVEGSRYISLTLSEINAFADRFFDRTLSWEDVYTSSYPTDQERVYAEFNIGYAEWNRVTVIDMMKQREDGLYEVTFSIYAAGESNLMIEDMSYYGMTIEEANSREDCYLFYRGSAVLRPIEKYGRETYQLLYYEKERVN